MLGVNEEPVGIPAEGAGVVSAAAPGDGLWSTDSAPASVRTDVAGSSNSALSRLSGRKGFEEEAVYTLAFNRPVDFCPVENGGRKGRFRRGMAACGVRARELSGILVHRVSGEKQWEMMSWRTLENSIRGEGERFVAELV